MAVLGLHCCAQAFSSCDKRGLLSLVAGHSLLVAAATLGRTQALGPGVRSYGVWA